MAAKSVEETSERKRISIPRADESVLAWWAQQHDPGLSIRTLIRAEIERSGYQDTVYKPVVQQPRRGRPPVSAAELDDEQETPVAPVVTILQPHVAPIREPAPAASSSSNSAIDAIMNG